MTETRPATPAESEHAERVLRFNRRLLFGLSAGTAAVGLALAGYVLLDGVGHFQMKHLVLGVGLPISLGWFLWYIWDILSVRALARSSGEVVTLTGELSDDFTRVESAYTHRLGLEYVHVPSLWWEYLGNGEPVTVEAVRADVSAGRPLYVAVATESGLSVEAEAQAGLARLHDDGRVLLALLGYFAALLGALWLGFASGVLGREPSPAPWPALSAAVAASGAALYDERAASPAGGPGRRWTVVAFGSAVAAVGGAAAALAFPYPAWATAAVAVVAALPLWLLLPFHPLRRPGRPAR